MKHFKSIITRFEEIFRLIKMNFRITQYVKLILLLYEHVSSVCAREAEVWNNNVHVTLPYKRHAFTFRRFNETTNCSIIVFMQSLFQNICITLCVSQYMYIKNNAPTNLRIQTIYCIFLAQSVNNIQPSLSVSCFQALSGHKSQL